MASQLNGHDVAMAAREDRIDLIRGVSLLLIFIGHSHFVFSGSFQNARGFSDASEFFVLLAGMSAGLAYYRPQLSFLAQCKAPLLRALKLYRTHVAMVLAFVAASTLAGPAMWGVLGGSLYAMLSDFWLHPVMSTAQVLTLTYAPGNLDILPLYCFLLAMFPLAVALRQRFPERVVLGISGLIWLVAGITHANLPNVAVSTQVWDFDPLSWQFIFVIGACLGIRLREGKAIFPYNRLLFGACVGLLSVSAPLALLIHYGLLIDHASAAYRLLLSKTMLGPLPLVHCLAGLYVLWNLDAVRKLGSVGWLQPVYAAGRNSLPVFVTGVFLSALVNAFMALEGTTPVAEQLLLLVIGVLAQLTYAEWLDGRRRSGRAVREAAIVLPES